MIYKKKARKCTICGITTYRNKYCTEHALTEHKKKKSKWSKDHALDRATKRRIARDIWLVTAPHIQRKERAKKEITPEMLVKRKAIKRELNRVYYLNHK